MSIIYQMLKKVESIARHYMTIPSQFGTFAGIYPLDGQRRGYLNISYIPKRLLSLNSLY